MRSIGTSVAAFMVVGLLGFQPALAGGPTRTRASGQKQTLSQATRDQIKALMADIEKNKTAAQALLQQAGALRTQATQVAKTDPAQAKSLEAQAQTIRAQVQPLVAQIKSDQQIAQLKK